MEQFEHGCREGTGALWRVAWEREGDARATAWWRVFLFSGRRRRRPLSRLPPMRVRPPRTQSYPDERGTRSEGGKQERGHTPRVPAAATSPRSGGGGDTARRDGRDGLEQEKKQRSRHTMDHIHKRGHPPPTEKLSHPRAQHSRGHPPRADDPRGKRRIFTPTQTPPPPTTRGTPSRGEPRRPPTAAAGRCGGCHPPPR